MKRIAAGVVAMGVAACVLVSSTRAAEPFAIVPVYGPEFLGFPLGVRNIGMGATGTADVNGFSTGHFNPASIAFADATTFLGSAEDLYLDFRLYDARISSPIPFRSDATASAWHFAGSFGYTVLDLPAQQERTIFLPEGTGRTFDPTDWMLSANAAASWSHGPVELGAGATAKFIRQVLAADNVEMWSFDIGVIAAFPLEIDAGGLFRPRLGYSALNLDTGASYDGREVFVRTESRGGFGFDLETPLVAVFQQSVPSARLSIDYDLIDREYDSVTKYSAGFELAIVNLVYARYGLIDEEYVTYGLGVGWDFGNVLFRMDYAHVELQDNAIGYVSYADLDRDTFGALVGVRW